MMIFLIKILIDFYVITLLLRIWMQLVYCDFYNYFSQLIIRFTQPSIILLYRIFPYFRSINNALFLLAIFLMMIKLSLIVFVDTKTPIFIPSYLFLSLIMVIKNIGKMVFWIVITSSLLRWVNQKHNPLNLVFNQLSEPLINLIRSILPLTDNVDLSPIILIVFLYFLNYIGINLFPKIWHYL